MAKRDAYVGGVAVGLTPASSRMTVGRQLADWLDERRGKVRDTTWVGYEKHVRIHLGSLYRIQLNRLRPADVRRLVAEREAEGCAPGTIAKSLEVLRMALNLAIADGLIGRNAAIGVSGPALGPSVAQFLSPEDARRLIANAPDTTYGRLWVVLLGTGLRLGEALALRRSDISGSGTLTVNGSLRAVDPRFRQGRRLVTGEPKTDAGRRTFAVPGFAWRALMDQVLVPADPTGRLPYAIEGYVFTTRTGTPLDARNVRHHWATDSAAMGLPRIRLHDLRHTAASLMLANGATLHDVMKVLGHASIAETANTYGHLVEGRSRELAEGLDRMIGGI